MGTAIEYVIILLPKQQLHVLHRFVVETSIRIMVEASY
jgi:hypothetical protein